MGPKMEEGGPSIGNQMKTEKWNGPTKTDATVKTDEGKKSGDQNGQMQKAGEGKDEEEAAGKGEKGEEQGEESLLRRIIRRLSMKKKKKKKKGKKKTAEAEKEMGVEKESKAQLDVEPKIVEKVNIEVTFSQQKIYAFDF